jgi:ABC-type sugar transport system permease subunit
VLRVAAGAVAAAAALAALAAGSWGARRTARELAGRSARSAAAYLALVTPEGDSGQAYDLEALLAQARGLGLLRGWAGAVEVYHGTAPLVRATAPPLPPALLARLRERETTERAGRGMVAPLKDKDDWDVVGAVSVRPVRRAAGLLAGWNVVLVVLGGVIGAAALGSAGGTGGRRWKVAGVAVAVLVGVSAYAESLAARRAATDQWMTASRVLLEEAVPRLAARGWSPVTQLAPLVRDARLIPAESGSSEIRRSVVDGVPRVETRLRAGGGRWLVLRALPSDVGAGGWLPITLGLALLGPLGVWLIGWVERARARPRALRETLAAWGFLAPATVHLAVFSFGPIGFAVYLAFHRWSPIEPIKPFVGLDNFIALARDPLTWISLRNTVLFTLHVPVAMALALGLALLLRHRTRGTAAARAVFFLPYVSSAVAVALVWQWIYHADFGLLNSVTGLFGLPKVDWLGNPHTALIAVMIVSIWVQVGYQMVVFLAGLQGIPQEYLDAARVDGAGAWQRFRRVTLPLLRPVTLFVLVTGVITSFQVFTLIYVLTDGGPLHATDVIVYRIYQMAWEFLQFGGASALSLVLFLVLFAATWAQFRLLGRRVHV